METTKSKKFSFKNLLITIFVAILKMLGYEKVQEDTEVIDQETDNDESLIEFYESLDSDSDENLIDEYEKNEANNEDEELISKYEKEVSEMAETTKVAGRTDYAPIARAYANLIWKGTRNYNDPDNISYERVKDHNFFASTSVVQYMLLDVYKMRNVNGCQCTDANFRIKTGLIYSEAWKKYIVDTGYQYQF